MLDFRGLEIHPPTFLPDPHFLAFPNGVLDSRGGVLEPSHLAPRSMLLKALGVCAGGYAPGVKGPRAAREVQLMRLGMRRGMR